MKVVLIGGHSGSGKDTFADFIKNHLPQKRVIIVHFGDPVKWIAQRYFNWDGDKNTVEGRGLLQYIGTTLMRSYNPDYWAKIIGEFLDALNKGNQYDIALIPDARWPNEIETIQNFFPDATTVRIDRINKDGEQYVNPHFSNDQLKHESENSLEYYAFNYIIENTGDLADLEDSAEVLIEDLTLG